MHTRDKKIKRYLKRQVLLFYRLGKKTQENLRGEGRGAVETTPPLYVRGLSSLAN